MEKILDPYDKEYMKMAMLKHEETFKEQVYELHRLYRMQKILMCQEKSKSKNNGIALNHNYMKQKSSERQIARSGNDGEKMFDTIDESEIELTLGPASYSQRKKAETPPVTSDSGRSFSSSSTGSSHSHIYRTNSGNHQRSESRRYQTGGKNNVDVEEQLRQGGIKQPPWLFQVLNLNMA